MQYVTGEWHLNRILLSGEEKIQIGGNQFEAIFAPVFKNKASFSPQRYANL